MMKVKLNALLSRLPHTDRKWSYFDLQYVALAVLFLIDLIVMKSPTIVPRLILASLFISTFWIPYIRRFTVPALPIFAWLITFYTCQFIPIDYRPSHIFVNLLPTLERILYGANLSEIISKHTHPVLDILAWLPYGVIHFSFPFILSLLLFIFGPPGSLGVFAKAFGYMNLAGVLTQLFFPNASPWYEIIYGSAPADYSIPGEAGGLLRIDEILGLDLYGSTFGTSPMVFGAFPSLHSGCASIEMLFVAYFFPKFKPVAVFYVMWMWFSTMYLTHHYMIDLVGGSIYAILTFAVAQKFLPKLNPEHRTRLGYLGITKSSIRSFIYSIEHDPHDYYSNLPVIAVHDEETAMKEIQLTTVTSLINQAQSYRHHHINNKPEPLRIMEMSEKRTVEEEEELSPSLSPASLTPSSGYWSPTSEPTSPITPHTPLNGHYRQFSFSKASN